jgi:hypothetical protein
MLKVCLFLLLIFSNHLSAVELGIVSMFRNEAPYLREWVNYHRLVGVQHFWLYDNGSTDHSLEILQPFIDEGLVEVINWPTLPGGEVFSTQVYAFKDGIRNSVGKAKWIAVIDIDEFIVPMKDKSILDCLNKRFSKNQAIYVNWLHFGTSGVEIPKGDPIMFQLTECSLSTHSNNGIGKSIIRPEYVDIDSVWYQHYFPLLPNASYVNGNRKKIAFNGLILSVDGIHYDNYLRINHYYFRDEWFYQNVRLAKAQQGMGNLELLLEHYKSFSLSEDFKIIELIQKLDVKNILGNG